MIEKNTGHQVYLKELISLQNSELLQAIEHSSGWQQRYTGILKLGRAIQEKPSIRTAHYEIKGCEAKLWVKSTIIDSNSYYIV
ncbi:MAG: SufE family protein, partial [Sinobacterium sp.]|nr:SufE family protein [Sinobacterium sp.]